MDAIKKKMQAMKVEKDNAMDRADACEQVTLSDNLKTLNPRRSGRDAHTTCVISTKNSNNRSHP